ncbi:MAG TPA: hypothetical protein VIM70_14585 [Clostridium sp.]
MKIKALLLSTFMVVSLLVGCGSTPSTNSIKPEATTSATVNK